jgi:hypothetical protein
MRPDIIVSRTRMDMCPLDINLFVGKWAFANESDLGPRFHTFGLKFFYFLVVIIIQRGVFHQRHL